MDEYDWLIRDETGCDDSDWEDVRWLLSQAGIDLKAYDNDEARGYIRSAWTVLRRRRREF